MVAAGATKDLVAVDDFVVGSTYPHIISRVRPKFFAIIGVGPIPASRFRHYMLRLFLYASLGRARPGIELLSREIARIFFQITFRPGSGMLRMKLLDGMGDIKRFQIVKKDCGKATKKGLEIL